ncbi:MAG: hypothetical protein KF859_10495 [Phycisphaeraceae bacterium]|nr:hypothetical protein [Phycisphaeraceae bacterium]
MVEGGEAQEGVGRAAEFGLVAQGAGLVAGSRCAGRAGVGLEDRGERGGGDGQVELGDESRAGSGRAED